MTQAEFLSRRGPRHLHRLKQDAKALPIDAFVGRRIRMRRTMLGWSMKKLAAILGLSLQQVRNYERGAQCVRAGRMFALSQALNVPAAFFFDGCEDISAAADDDPLLQHEIGRLLGIYWRLTPNLRRAFFELVKQLADMAAEQFEWLDGDRSSASRSSKALPTADPLE